MLYFFPMASSRVIGNGSHLITSCVHVPWLLCFQSVEQRKIRRNLQNWTRPGSASESLALLQVGAICSLFYLRDMLKVVEKFGKVAHVNTLANDEPLFLPSCVKTTQKFLLLFSPCCYFCFFPAFFSIGGGRGSKKISFLFKFFIAAKARDEAIIAVIQRMEKPIKQVLDRVEVDSSIPLHLQKVNPFSAGEGFSCASCGWEMKACLVRD